MYRQIFIRLNLRLLTSFSCVLLDFINQIFISMIHDCSETSHLWIRMLSIVLVCQKFIIRFFKLYFPFGGPSQSKEVLNSSIEYLHCSLALRGTVYSIDSSTCFRFTKFSKRLFLNSLHLSVRCQSEILCVMKYF